MLLTNQVLVSCDVLFSADDAMVTMLLRLLLPDNPDFWGKIRENSHCPQFLNSKKENLR